MFDFVSLRVLIVNIRMRDSSAEGELLPIVGRSGDKADHDNGRVRSFRDSDDGAGLDAFNDDESAHLAPASRGGGGARGIARRDYSDDGL